MFQQRQPKVFEPGSKPEISLTMTRIGSWEDDGYGLSFSHFVDGAVEGGQEASIDGVADDFWRGGKRILGSRLRMHIKLASDLSRRDMERGILGGGSFRGDYVNIDLNLEPEQVRDIVHELRHSAARQVHVDGRAISDKIFRVTRFSLSAPAHETA